MNNSKKIKNSQIITDSPSNVQSYNEKSIGNIHNDFDKKGKVGSVRGNRYSSLDAFGTLGLDVAKSATAKRDVTTIPVGINYRDVTTINNHEQPWEKTENHRIISPSFGQRYIQEENQKIAARAVKRAEKHGLRSDFTPSVAADIDSVLDRSTSNSKDALSDEMDRSTFNSLPENNGDSTTIFGRRFDGREGIPNSDEGLFTELSRVVRERSSLRGVIGNLETPLDTSLRDNPFSLELARAAEAAQKRRRVESSASNADNGLPVNAGSNIFGRTVSANDNAFREIPEGHSRQTSNQQIRSETALGPPGRIKRVLDKVESDRTPSLSNLTTLPSRDEKGAFSRFPKQIASLPTSIRFHGTDTDVPANASADEINAILEEKFTGKSRKKGKAKAK